MPCRRSFFIVMVLLSLASSASASDRVKPVTAGKPLHCWRLEQQNVIFGDCTIYACDQALKVVFKNGRWLNLAKGPVWELFVFNPVQKIYCRTPLDKWKANSVQLGLADSTGPTELVRTKEEQKICGLMAVKIEPRLVGASAGKNQKRNYWVARDLHLPDQVCHVLCGNGLLPQLHAVPLRVCANAGGVINTIETTSARQIDLPISFFDMPVGCKETKHPEDVMNSGVMDVVRDMTGF